MHPNSRLLFEKYAFDVFRPGARVLEIGPDGDPSTFRRLVGDRVAAWETLDIAPRPGVDHVAAGEYAFGLPDDHFDVVLSAQVIEHVRRVWTWMVEVARVCKPGGTVVTINPVSWPYHEAPIDCWRIYPEGMRALYDEAGLTVSLCEWGSLEDDGLPAPYGGRSRKPLQRRKPRSVARRVAEKLGYPTSVAYDTITIGTKPGPAA